MKARDLGERVTDCEGRPEDLIVELIARYQVPLFRYLVVFLGSRDLAEECAQDAFVRAYEHLSQRKPVSSAWLYTVARNRAIDELRRRRRQRSGVPMEEVAIEGLGDFELRQVLDALEPDDRALLYLIAVDGFSADEIAAMLGISRAASYMRISRARRRLRMVLGDRDEA